MDDACPTYPLSQVKEPASRAHAIIQQAKTSWLRNADVVELLAKRRAFQLPQSLDFPKRPEGGELYLVAADKKKRDSFLHMNESQQQGSHGLHGPAEFEANKPLEVDKENALSCHYVHPAGPDTLQGRCYWLLEGDEGFNLVHYLKGATTHPGSDGLVPGTLSQRSSQSRMDVLGSHLSSFNLQPPSQLPPMNEASSICVAAHSQAAQEGRILSATKPHDPGKQPSSIPLSDRPPPVDYAAEPMKRTLVRHGVTHPREDEMEENFAAQLAQQVQQAHLFQQYFLDQQLAFQAALVERQRQHQEFLGNYRVLIAADRQMRAQYVANLLAWLALTRQAPLNRQADGGGREGPQNPDDHPPSPHTP